LTDHENHTQGKLNKFLESLYSRGKYPISTVYRTIYHEIRRKNNYKVSSGTFEELITKKAIGKSGFETILKGIGIKTDLDEGWATIETRLNVEGIPINSIIKIKREWKRCELDRMDATNDSIQKMVIAVRSAISSLLDCGSLKELIDKGYQACSPLPQVKKALRNQDYIKAMILMEYYEHHQLTETDQKSEEEES
jgi:hypothetical protein